MHRRRNQSVKRLLWAMALFAGVQGALTAADTLGWFSICDPIYTDKLGLLDQYPEFRRSSPEEDTILLLGSSRVMMGLDAGSISGPSLTVFNFGIAGGGPMTANLYFRRLLAEGVRPDVVVVEVMPVFFLGDSAMEIDGEARPSTSIPNLEGRWLTPNRIHPEELQQVNSWPPAYLRDGATWERRWLPLYAYRSAILLQLAPAWLPNSIRLNTIGITNAWGWVRPPVAAVSASQYQDGLRGAYQEFQAYFERPVQEVGGVIEGPSCRALEDLVSLCDSEGIPSALLLMPESSEFRGWYPPEMEPELIDYLSRLASEHNCSWFDAREWVSDGAFIDGHHLTRLGAATFTERFNREVLPSLRAIIEGREP